jgi:hypothetical protein
LQRVLQLLLHALLFVCGGAESITPGTCACAHALEHDGWCDVHGIGYVGSVEVRSQLLFEALDAHGHDVDPSTFDCPSCRKAVETSGFCPTHRVGFVGGQAYFSRLTYDLARGKRLTPSEVTCPVCRKHMLGRGWCPSCGVGMVGSVALRDRQAFDGVDHALKLVEAANRVASRCENCAVAMVFDGTCPICGIRYQDGKEVGRVTPPRKVD